MSKPNNQDCPAFCPLCGADLYNVDQTCVCKNPKCNWSCTRCRDEDPENE